MGQTLGMCRCLTVHPSKEPGVVVEIQRKKLGFLGVQECLSDHGVLGAAGAEWKGRLFPHFPPRLERAFFFSTNTQVPGRQGADSKQNLRIKGVGGEISEQVEVGLCS